MTDDANKLSPVNPNDDGNSSATSLSNPSETARNTSTTIQLIESDLEVIEETISSLRSRLEAENLVKEVKELRIKYDEAVGDPAQFSGKTFECRLAFVRRCRDATSNLLQFASEHSTKHPDEPTEGLALLKLPALDIPSFRGELSKWASFKTNFLNIINDSRISGNNDAKRQFLFRALEGDKNEARALIENLRDASFDQAWEILCQTYDDPLRRAKAHYDALVEVKGTRQGLRKRLVEFRQHATGIRGAYSERNLDPFDQILISWFLEGVQQQVAMEWERMLTEGKANTLAEFFRFVEQRCLQIERVGGVKPGSSGNSKKGVSLVTAKPTNRSKRTRKCVCCQNTNHYLSGCEKFRRMSPEERIQFVKERELCTVCLCSVPTVCPRGDKKCPKQFLYCKVCKKAHHRLLHQKSNTGKHTSKYSRTSTKISRINDTAGEIDAISLPPSCSYDSQRCIVNKVVACYMVSHRTHESLLTTAIVMVSVDGSKELFEARAILDSGSQFDFITRRLVNRLNVSPSQTSYSVVGLGQASIPITKCASVRISSSTSAFRATQCCLVVDCIVNSMIPNQFFEIDSWNIPNNLALADPHFNIPADIDLLLGLECFWSILGNQQVRLEVGRPTLRSSKFGWLVTGSMQVSNLQDTSYVFFSKQDMSSLMKMMERFWVTENLDISSRALTSEEQECEQLFQSTTYQREDGRFVVRLPLSEDPSVLGNSRLQAERRFQYLEKRLSNNPILRKQYTACMNEYLSLGHMDLVSEDCEVPGTTYYIPHHAVVKETSSTTKLRVVFDASMKSSSSVSLNDICKKGPVVQPKLFSTLLRFRFHKYVFVADVTKMYRQVKVHPNDTSLQLILWRDSAEKPIGTYRLNTLTFGTKPAPYLATRCLKELALRYGCKYPAAAPVLLNDFYVDDVLTGCNRLDLALQIKEQLCAALGTVGFELNKWGSNEPQLLADVEDTRLEKHFSLSLDEKQTIKTLGVLWLPTDDVFKILIHSDRISESKTRRQVLSIIMSIFDPLGLTGPVTCKAKWFMQQLWKYAEGGKHSGRKAKTLGWDDELPSEFLSSWKAFTSQLHSLNQIAIPRHVLKGSSAEVVELHGFADASAKAYGCVLYLRVLDSSGSVTVSLLCSKSRVAPLKELTIPRLELCAANLLAELAHEVYHSSTVIQKIDGVRLWSDSQVVLTWISSSSSRWNVYVAHRVSKIQSLTSNWSWDYVESAHNPADVLSRGCNPQELMQHSLWFSGPGWLTSSNNPWPVGRNFIPSQTEQTERRIAVLTVTKVTSELFSLVGKPSTGTYSFEIWWKNGLIKLIRLVSWFLRFRNNCQPYFPRTTGNLKFFEFQCAKVLLIKLAQQEDFINEIKCLKGKKPLYHDSKLLSLCPVLDSNGILRVGGRLENATMSFEQRHPIVLQSGHHLTKLLVSQEHIVHFHAGPRLLKSVMRREYWILRLDNAVKDCLRSCITCTKQKAKTYSEAMANLPKSRVTLVRPFHETGVDYAGPYNIVGKGGRHKVMLKAYIAVFVCFSTKAMHLELVSDLTSEAFLAALRRFISRRGIPSVIHSDNGTNFVGAHASLKKLYKFFQENHEVVENFVLGKGFRWSFIPPRSPHFGGLWEAGVKSVKGRLDHILANKALNFEEFSTLLVQIEACLNSRPLTPESADPNDLNALTPGHFLIGGPITALPNESLVHIPENRVKGWKRVQRLHQLFWQRFSAEYLNTLQQRVKWRFQKNEIRKNDFVVVKEDNLPPTQWRMGRIEMLHPGADGLNRVATVRTSSGLIKRPCVKLVPLLTEE